MCASPHPNAHGRHRGERISSTSLCHHTPCNTAVGRRSGRARYVRSSSFILSHSNKRLYPSLSS
jgi:hypothetical protein